MSVNIRSARKRDAASVVAMAQELSDGEGKPPRSLSEAGFRRDGFGLKPAFSCLLVEVDGATAGYALFHPAYDAEDGQRGAFLHDLYLRAPYRGRGLGRALLAEVCRTTKGAGGRFVWWSMIKGSAQAESFYRHLAKPLDDLQVWIAADEHFERLAQDDALFR
ncbi:MAG: GNAT family N-acetyltransferase [Rhodospirillales bacterium]|nr:GNAT family N-acetyltransferase [Rhodospirillales bacterium]